MSSVNHSKRFFRAALLLGRIALRLHGPLSTCPSGPACLAQSIPRTKSGKKNRSFAAWFSGPAQTGQGWPRRLLLVASATDCARSFPRPGLDTSAIQTDAGGMRTGASASISNRNASRVLWGAFPEGPWTRESALGRPRLGAPQSESPRQIESPAERRPLRFWSPMTGI